MTIAHHLADTGTAFRIRVVDEAGVAVDLSGATLKQILFKPPNAGALKTETAVFPTPGAKGYPAASPGDGTDGYMEFVTVASTLDVQGAWKFQGHVDLPTIGVRHTSVASFQVDYNLL